jgi:hypothetical protein
MAEAFAILRTKKLKTPGNVAGSASHIERSRPTHNAQPGVANEWLEGGPGMYARAKEIWDSVPKKRSDAVHAFEVLLTASPEAFVNGMDVDAWKVRAMAWLREQYKGAEIIGACLHLDETTPHIQAILVPTDRKPDGSLQLNCKKYLGSAAKLSAMQTSYAKAMAPLGLQRGLQGSKAHHTQISQFYDEIKHAGRVKIQRPVVATPPMLLTLKGREAWAAGQSQEIAKALGAPLNSMRAKAAEAGIHKRQNRELKASNSALSAQNAEYKRKEAAARLRDLPLETVAQALGCYKSPKVVQKDKDLWESPQGKLSIKGTKFFNQEDGKGGGGAFDLVMHINDCSYVEALAWLRDTYDPAAAVEAAVEAARIQAQTQVAKAPAAPFRTPQHDDRHWPRVRDYLTSVRALAGELVDRLRADGWLGADSRANAFFVKILGGKTTSVELKGTGNSLFTGSRGRSSEGVFVVKGGNDKLAVCEAPIDAISYVQLHPQSTAIATGGTGKWRAAIEYLVKYRDQFKSVVCASDNDPGGVEMAGNLGLDHEPPPNGLGDWNEAVKALRDDPHALDAKDASKRTTGPSRPKARPKANDASGLEI